MPSDHGPHPLHLSSAHGERPFFFPERYSPPLLQQLLARLGITPDLPSDEAAYAPGSPLTKQASTAFQNLRAPLTVMLGLGQRVGVGENKSFHGDLDGMVRAGMEGLSAANPFALAWSQALPNIVNLVGGRGGGVCGGSDDCRDSVCVCCVARVMCWGRVLLLPGIFLALAVGWC